MKKLSITKEQFEKSRYFKNKYGKLEYVSESGKVFKTSKGKESSNANSFWHEYETEMAKYLKKLDKDLYEACTMTDEYRGHTFSTGKREWNWDFWSAQNKALDAVAEEIADEVGEEITIVDDVVEYTTGKDLAHRVVDYILTEKPSKLLARKLAKIGY